MNKLFLVDAYSIIYRAYYALMRSPRINSKHFNTSAVYGFVNILNDVLSNDELTHIAVAFDPATPTFRHNDFPQYKANRDAAPEDIHLSVPIIKQIVAAMNIPIVEADGFEADDVIGTLAHQAAQKGFEVYMLTPDKDYGQLVTDKIKIYKPRYGEGGYDVLGVQEVLDKWGLSSTAQVIDLLGLMGDSSDNIPGCPGVGEKTAVKLLTEYGSIDNLINSAQDMKKSALKDKILNNIDNIRLSKYLATIRLDVPVTFDEAATARKKPDYPKLVEIYKEMEFNFLLKKLSAEGVDIGSLDFSSKASTVNSHGKVSGTTENISKPSLFDEFNDTKSTSIDASTGSIDDNALQGKKAIIDSDTAMVNAHNALQYSMTVGQQNENQPGRILDTINSVKHEYYKTATVAEYEALAAELNAAVSFAFDTETTGVDVHNSSLVGISFAINPHQAYYIPLPQEINDAVEILSYFKKPLENSDIEKCGHNIKFDIMMLAKYGVHVAGPLFDSMIAHYLIQPELYHNMDFLAELLLGYKTIHIEELIGEKGKNQLNMRQVNIDRVVDYAAEDADITLQLCNSLKPQIEDLQLHTLCYDIEMPLIYVLAKMEMTGVIVDDFSLAQSSQILTQQMLAIENNIRKEAGFAINVSSPMQVGKLLFEVLAISDKPKKTKRGQYVTDEDTLESLRYKHPVVGEILEYRGLKKLLSTYIDALPKLIDEKSGRIHTSFNQTVTATGRLSSSNPNLQNIPIRNEDGKEIRRAFVASEGYKFLSADYSQVELRIMAHLSQDENLVEAFVKDYDIHAATAAKIFKVPIEEVTSDMRRKAKTANFGIIYGVSAFGLSERLGVSRTEAKKLIDDYFENFPGVRKYIDDSVDLARKKGFVETIMHRRRYLPDINSRNSNVRGYAERNAVNAPIQGSAADIIKLAMVKIDSRLQAEQLRAEMILQVHDELNFNVPEDEVDRLTAIVREEMENAIHLSVPLKVDIGIGNNWLEAH